MKPQPHLQSRRRTDHKFSHKPATLAEAASGESFAMSKNIIICCDGTGNEIGENISNVLKLYRCLRKTPKTEPHQLVFYDPGVGTLARPDPWRKVWQDFVAVFGLATGYGLDDQVLGAYQFLVQNYAEGDQIYLFGYSRGAYAVRVLAGLIHKIGLLWPQQVNLAASGLTSYKQFASDEPQAAESAGPEPTDDDGPLPATRDDRTTQFARILSTRWPTIRFIGVWDTVASVIVPRPDRLYWPSVEELAFTLVNPSVKCFRQAMAIDERRSMFRLKRWEEPQTFAHDRFNQAGAEPQDCKQVWFAGVHGDIGGSYPESSGALSKYPLLWMIAEAAACGLAFNPQSIHQLGWGVQRRGSPYSYVAPDVAGELHNSMNWSWRLLEYIPKPDKYKEWPQRTSRFGHYVPDAEPRRIGEGAFIHESAAERMAAVADYRPVNWPRTYQTVRMPEEP
jgi:uncharacterized protein (DUF2235 family)